MTISSTNRKAGPYTGNDSTTAFPFAFKVFSASDLLVVRADSTGGESTLVLDTDFTAVLNADQDESPGGTVTLSSALAAGYTLVISSNLSNLQPTDLTNQGGFYPRVISSALDRLTILIQQLAESVSRSLKTSITTPPGVNPTLPSPVPYQLIGWNGGGTGLQNTDPTYSTALATDLANMVDATKGAKLVGFLQSGASAVGRTAQDKLREVASPEDFGAVGDGVASDYSAFVKAFAAARRLRLTAGKTYWLGNVSSNNALFAFSGVDGRGIDFNGGKITVTTSGGNYNAPLFSLDNMVGFHLCDPWIQDLGFDQAQTWKGISVVRLHPASGPVRNVFMHGCKFESVVAGLDTDTYVNRASGIFFEGDIRNCYYGINLANNGDSLIANYTTYNAVRSYFCYGIVNHDIVCISENHNAVGNADFLIHVAEAANPTRGIRGRFTSKNSQATTNPQLVFQSKNDTGTTMISECDIFYDDRQSPGMSYSIAFRHYNNAGVLQASDPNTKSGITVRGFAQQDVVVLSAPTQPQLNDFRGIRSHPSFLAIKTTPSLNVTGAGTAVDVVFDTKQHDTHTDYNAATGVFTAPYEGVYSFCAQALVIDKTAAMTRVDMKLVTTGKTFTNTATNTNTSYPEQTSSISIPAVKLAAGDTVKVQVVAYNGAGNTADIYGDSTIAFTYFSGALVR